MQVVSAQRLRRLVQGGTLALFMAFSVISFTALRAQEKSSVGARKGASLIAAAAAQAGASSPVRLADTYARLPLSFEANQGQAQKPVQFVSRGQGYTLALSAGEAVLALKGRQLSVVSRQSQPSGSIENRAADSLLAMRLLGSSPKAAVTASDQLPGRANYFIGNDPRNWHANIPTYAKVKYENVYPGVDLVYYGNQGQLEYDFVVAPGADPGVIQLALGSGPALSSALRLAVNGDLLVQLPGGEVRFQQPVVYQPAATDGYRTTARKLVVGHYRVVNDQVRFEIPSYDKTRPLVIDPTLTYSTYLGGTGADTAGGIAVDGSGDVYITGATASANFPVSSAPLQKANDGGHDVFVSEISSDGTTLVFSTYIGGSGDDYGAAIALDSTGAAYVTGNTDSANFPVTSNVKQTANSGKIDAFITKLSPGGATLAYSTYLGGKQNDYGTAIAVDSKGDVYVAGYTDSIDFPLTKSNFQGSLLGATNAFFTELNATGGAPALYSTYFGGAGTDMASGIALDASVKAYIVGSSTSLNLPTGGTTAYQKANAGASDAFVAEFDSTQSGASSLLFATYLGGSGNDNANAIALDASENIYVTGSTASSNFPVSTGVLQAALKGSSDVFVTKFNPGAATLSYSTYLGGTGPDSAAAIAIDADGNALLTGNTQSSNFPTQGPLQATCATTTAVTCNDAFVASLSSDATGLNYSTYLGGGQPDSGVGIALDNGTPQNAYVIGSTTSGDFPTTPKPFQATCGAAPVSSTCAGNAFVAKIEAAAPNLDVAPVVLPFGVVPTSITSSPQTTTVTNNTGAAVTFSSIAASAGFVVSPAGTTCLTSAALASGASCAVAVTFTPSVSGVQTGTLTLTDSAPSGSQVVDLAGTGVASVVSLAPASLVFSGESVGAQSAPQTVTLTNSGSGPLTISAIAVTGAGFAETNTCGSSVAAGSTCSISVTYTPAVSGAASGTLTVSDNATGSPQTVSLSGTGISPGASLSTTTLNFGSQVVNTRSSTPQSVTLTNTGSSNLSVNSVTVSGPNATDFTLLQKAPCGSSIAVGSSCAIQLNFKPMVSGSRSATLSIADSAPGSPQTVALSGTGADFSVTATPATATVNPGGSTSYTVTVAPIGGFAGTVTLTCTGQPTYGTCTIPSPGTVTLDGTSNTQMKFTVTTLAPAAAPHGFGRFLPPTSRMPWVIALLAGMLSLLVLARARGRRALILFAATLLMAAFWASCSGGPASGNQNNPANNGTPPGTYTMTITGAAQGLGNSTTVAVKVN
ncbi:MAG TPA: SBBP repeat-containing protein [Terriglobia bacterium]|nr:SBBP repeat-containing protein [Terriglobia bacterium]